MREAWGRGLSAWVTFGTGRDGVVAHTDIWDAGFAHHVVLHFALLAYGSFGMELGWDCAWLLTKRCDPSLDLFKAFCESSICSYTTFWVSVSYLV